MPPAKRQPAPKRSKPATSAKPAKPRAAKKPPREKLTRAIAAPASPSSTTHSDLPFALPPVTDAQRRRASDLAAALAHAYPDAHCELTFTSPLELLIATILSAQATDVGVNKATPALFARFKTAADYAAVSPRDIEPFIRTIGLYRNKAASIHSAATDIVNNFAGQVPRTMDELTTLRGVGRKTAGVVLGNAFNINVGFVVDTHVTRLAVRLGLVPRGTPVPKIERALMALFPRDQWCLIGHRFIFHGRRACKARLPACSPHPICQTFGQTCELRIKGKKSR